MNVGAPHLPIVRMTVSSAPMAKSAVAPPILSECVPNCSAVGQKKYENTKCEILIGSTNIEFETLTLILKEVPESLPHSHQVDRFDHAHQSTSLPVYLAVYHLPESTSRW